jgi:hypothetical protein
VIASKRKEGAAIAHSWMPDVSIQKLHCTAVVPNLWSIVWTNCVSKANLWKWLLGITRTNLKKEEGGGLRARIFQRGWWPLKELQKNLKGIMIWGAKSPLALLWTPCCGYWWTRPILATNKHFKTVINCYIYCWYKCSDNK